MKKARGQELLKHCPLQLVGGADFSAAREKPMKPNSTWLALGELRDNGQIVSADRLLPCRYHLHIHTLRHTGANMLAQKIIKAKSKKLSSGLESPRLTVGLDFPFSFPKGFMDYLAAEGVSDSIHQIPFERLESLSIEYFKLRGGEERRNTDKRCRPMAQSPLHRINPGMLKMTHTGAKVLDELRAAGMAVMPWDLRLESPSQILEVYPAAILRWFNLPYQKYKRAVAGADQVRQEILDGLCKLHTVNSDSRLALQVVLEPSLRPLCLRNDDALDGVIACISAAVAVCYPQLVGPALRLTHRQKRPSVPVQAKEGWIYTPWHKLP